MASVTMEGHLIRVVSPEGQRAEMPIADFVAKVAPPRMNSCGLVLPAGTKLIATSGPLTVLVHETPPQVRTLKWIAANSRKRWRGATYRDVRIALPYLVVIAVFEHGLISDVNECFFRVAPLDSDHDELLYPALLNCSRFQPPDGKPLSWICTQRLDRTEVLAETNPQRRYRLGLRALMHCLLETGFNWSSEDHEGSSWFSESTGIDERLATVEKWEAATAEQGPLFVFDVPWLKTGLTVQQVVERVFGNHGLPRPAALTEADVARMVFNHRANGAGAVTA